MSDITGKVAKIIHKPLRVMHFAPQLVVGMELEGVEYKIPCVAGQAGPIGEALQQLDVNTEAVTQKKFFDWSLVARNFKLLRRERVGVVRCHNCSLSAYGLISVLRASAKPPFSLPIMEFYGNQYKRKKLSVGAFRQVSKKLAQNTFISGYLFFYQALKKSR